MAQDTSPGAPSRQGRGWLHGFIGMLIFSGSMPATRLAVADFEPVFLTLARASLAGLLAVAFVVITLVLELARIPYLDRRAGRRRRRAGRNLQAQGGSASRST